MIQEYKIGSNRGRPRIWLEGKRLTASGIGRGDKFTTYKVDGGVCNDITISQKKVEIFDHYYDKYKKDLINIVQSKGTANPKLWKGVEKDGKGV